MKFVALFGSSPQEVRCNYTVIVSQELHSIPIPLINHNLVLQCSALVPISDAVVLNTFLEFP